MNRFIVRSSVLLLSVLSAFSMEKNELPQFEKEILQLEQNDETLKGDLAFVRMESQGQDPLDLRDTLFTLTNKNDLLKLNLLKIKEDLNDFVSNKKNYIKEKDNSSKMYSTLIFMALEALSLDLSKESTRKEFNHFFLNTLKKNSFQLALLCLTNKNIESIKEKIVLGIIVQYFIEKNINGHGLEAMVIENGFAEHKDIIFKKNADKVGEWLKINFQLEKALKDLIYTIAAEIQKLTREQERLKPSKGDSENSFGNIKGISEYENKMRFEKNITIIAELQEKITQYNQEIVDNHDATLRNLNHGSHVAGIVSEIARGVKIIPAPSSVIFSEKQKKLCTENKKQHEIKKEKIEKSKQKEKPIDIIIERMDENYKKMSEDYDNLKFGEKDYDGKTSFFYEFYKDIIRLCEAIDVLYPKCNVPLLRPLDEELIKIELFFALQNNKFSKRDMLDKYEDAKRRYTSKKMVDKIFRSTSSLHPINVSHPMRGRVISCSVALEDTCSDLLYQLCDNGKLCFYAAGNEGAFLSEKRTQSCKETRDIYMSSDLKDHLILVGNYDAKQGVIAESSNLPGKDFMDRFVYASGTDIESSVICSESYKQEKKSKTGTSMSAPHAAGISVLLDKYFPDATGDQIRDALLSTATPLMDYQCSEISGRGLLNGLAAAQSLLNQLDNGNKNTYTENEIIPFLFKNFPEVSFKKALEISTTVSPIKNRVFQRIKMINESYAHIMEKINYVEKSLKGDNSDAEKLKANIDKIVLDKNDPASKYLSQRIYDWMKLL